MCFQTNKLKIHPIGMATLKNTIFGSYYIQCTVATKNRTSENGKTPKLGHMGVRTLAHSVSDVRAFKIWLKSFGFWTF